MNDTIGISNMSPLCHFFFLISISPCFISFHNYTHTHKREEPSLNTQSCIRRSLCSTSRFENLSISPKKPVFSTFSNFFNIKRKKIIKAILCNFSMRLLKYFQNFFKNFFCPPKHRKTPLKSCS